MKARLSWPRPGSALTARPSSEAAPLAVQAHLAQLVVQHRRDERLLPARADDVGRAPEAEMQTEVLPEQPRGQAQRLVAEAHAGGPLGRRLELAADGGVDGVAHA